MSDLWSSAVLTDAKQPSWKSDDARDVVQALYGSRSTLFQRESLGLISDDNNCVFPPSIVAALFAAARVTVPHDSLESLFMCIDPSGGGASEFACLTCAEIANKFVVSLIYNHSSLITIARSFSVQPMYKYCISGFASFATVVLYTSLACPIACPTLS